MLKDELRIYPNFLLYVFILLVVAACSSRTENEIPPELRDEDWLNQSNCSGCWRGLKVGETSREDSLSLVRNLSFVGKPTGTSGFFCKKPVDAHCIGLMFDDGILTRIHLFLNYPITFEQAVEKLGTPDGFDVTQMHIDDLKSGCMLRLFWIEKQMILENIETPKYFGKDLCRKVDDRGGLVPKGILVEDVTYMQKEALKDLMTKDHSVSWNGFSDK